MPLIDCPDCSKPVSDRASFCPTCGCPSKYFPHAEPPPIKPVQAPLRAILEPFQTLGRVALLLTAAAIAIDLVGLSVNDHQFRFRGIGLVGGAQILVFSLLHYRWWASLPVGQRRTTPERAVAGCLVPLFNLMWLRTAWFGLTEDLNTFLAAKMTPEHAGSTLLTQIHVVVYYLVSPLVAAMPFFGVLPLPYWVHVLVDVAAFGTLLGFIGEANKSAGYVRGHLARGG